MTTSPSGAARRRIDGFTFTADASGRPLSAEGWLCVAAAPRDTAAQRRVTAGRSGWHAGHLVPARFGGPGGPENLVPMPARLNTSHVSAVEHMIARHLRSGPVFLRVTVTYSGTGPVPASVRHELFVRHPSGEIAPLPGADVTTNLEADPCGLISDARDAYTGARIAPKHFLDPHDRRGSGAGLAH